MPTTIVSASGDMAAAEIGFRILYEHLHAGLHQ